jgi:hypothetical protein
MSPPLHFCTKNWNCDKSLRVQHDLADRIYKLLKTYSADYFRWWPERRIPIPVRTISMRAMQVMVDMVIDLLDRIAREAAYILELKGKETLTVDDIHTGARLVLQDGKRTERMRAVLSWS